MIRFKTILALTACLALAACASPTRDSRGLPDDGGKTSHEVCTESCNHDYDVCMDSAVPTHDNGRTSGMFGNSAGCGSDLTECLHECRSAGVPDPVGAPPQGQ